MEILPLKNTKKFLGEIELRTQVGRVRVTRHEYSAILDKKTCQLCGSLDGMVMEAGNSDYSIYMPPLHSACRCLFISHTSRQRFVPPITWKIPPKGLIEKFAPKLLNLPIKVYKDYTEKILPVKKEEISNKVVGKQFKRDILDIGEKEFIVKEQENIILKKGLEAKREIAVILDNKGTVLLDKTGVRIMCNLLNTKWI